MIQLLFASADLTQTSNLRQYISDGWLIPFDEYNNEWEDIDNVLDNTIAEHITGESVAPSATENLLKILSMVTATKPKTKLEQLGKPTFTKYTVWSNPPTLAF